MDKEKRELLQQFEKGLNRWRSFRYLPIVAGSIVGFLVLILLDNWLNPYKESPLKGITMFFWTVPFPILVHFLFDLRFKKFERKVMYLQDEVNGRKEERKGLERFNKDS